MTNKRIFCRRSHPDVFCKKGALKALFARKALYDFFFVANVIDSETLQKLPN